MSLLSYYLVKENFIGLKDFRNFGVKRWVLWPIIETLYEKGSRYFPRQYLFTGK